MQQRTKRLAVIWAKTYLSFVLVCAVGLGFVYVISVLPDIYGIIAVSALIIGGVGYSTFGIAKIRLESEERDQARILRSLSKGYDE